MPEVKFGDIICGMRQIVDVCVYASKVDPDKWERVEDVVVKYGKKWYYGTIKYEDKTESEQYLIHDKVGDDGWGAIVIYKDVEVVGYQPDRNLRVRTAVGW